MKYIIIILSLLSFFIFENEIAAQKNCKVLIPQIDSIYTGHCKKGLAHGKGQAFGTDYYRGKFKEGYPSGKGTYVWANGDQYTGDWKEGKRNGEGTLTLKTPKGDSIIDGLWENDQYMGHKAVPPKVITKISIDRYNFRLSGGTQNRVLIDFYQNGMRNKTISNLTMISSSGVETTLGNSIGYEFVEFPVTIKLNYQTMNKLRAKEYQAIFEFIITEPGDWIVEIHN